MGKTYKIVDGYVLKHTPTDTQKDNVWHYSSQNSFKDCQDFGSKQFKALNKGDVVYSMFVPNQLDQWNEQGDDKDYHMYNCRNMSFPKGSPLYDDIQQQRYVASKISEVQAGFSHLDFDVKTPLSLSLGQQIPTIIGGFVLFGFVGYFIFILVKTK